MFKVMIADDNPYILQDLAEAIDWENFDFELTGAYQNGKDLLEAAGASCPDLVITDISMPQMDGIQLSSHLCQLNPDIQIIFISGYSEFEYARKALNLHILDYLVKPIVKEQLISLMEKTLQLLQKKQLQQFEQQKLQSQQEYFRKTALSHYICRLLFHPDQEPQIKQEFSQLGLTLPEQFQLYVVCYSLAKQSGFEEQSFSFSYFSLLFEEDLMASQAIQIMQDEQCGSFLLIVYDPSLSIQEQLSKLCVDVETQLQVCITMGYSSPSDHFSDLPDLYKQAHSAIAYFKETAIQVPVIAYHDIPAETDSTHKPHNNLASYSEKISAMRTFIEENYMNPITTHDVANSVYFSSTYANTCFHQECGITIFAYITQYRIEKAKELLRDTDEQITRIAELVGYSGKTSFYLAFKRHAGISPSEYRYSCEETSTGW